MIKNFIIWIGMAIISWLVIIAFTFFVLLATESGRGFFVSKFVPIVAKIAGYELNIKGVESKSLGSWNFNKIEFFDKDKKIFGAENFGFKFSPSKILKKEMIINHITSDKVELHIYDNKKEKEDVENSSSKVELNPFSIERINLKSLRIYNHPINKYYDYSLSGDVFFLSKEAPILVNLNMKSLDNRGLKLKLKTIAKNNKSNISGELFEKSGGIFSDILSNQYQDIKLAWDFDISKKDNLYSLQINNISSSYLENPVSGKGRLDINLNMDNINKSWLKSDLSLSGSYNTVPIIIDVKSDVNKERIEINKLNVSFKEYGSLKVFGNLKENNLDFDIKLNNINTEILSNFDINLQPAILNSNIKILGNIDNPEIKGNSSLKSKLKGKKFPKDIALTTNIDTKKGIIYIDNAILVNNSNLGYINVFSNLNSLKNGNPEINLKSNMDLSYIKYFFDHEDYILKGVLGSDLKINKNDQGIKINGFVNLNDGYFEDEVNGIKLYNIETRIIANATQIEIKEFKANDAEKGSINSSGIINWSDINNRIDINAVLKNMSFLDRDDIEALANGNIDINGDFKELLVKGDFDISPLNISLEKLPSSYVSELKVTEIFDYSDLEEKTRQGNMPIINLDINLRTKNQAFLRGRGLDAELKGDIKISGDVDNPNLSGAFEIIRGSYTLLEKKFDLTGGRIVLEGQEIFLSIKASHESNDQEYIANIEGGLDDLEIKFSSVPTMPEDEIISNLLFGKSAQDISPFQAIKLANSIKSIKEGGSGFNPVDTIRDKIGLDSISIDTESDDEDNQGLNIGVGKYIGEKVYLELEKTNDPQEPFRGNVEVEIIPNLNLKTTTGGEVGIEWKRDY